ncbi:putative virulence factor, partial [bacterium]|nr:putative virulence factor [bacterium]
MNDMFYSQEDMKTLKKAQILNEAAHEASSWVKKSPLRHKNPNLRLETADLHRIAKNIEKAAGRPMTVALFGPSGAGKSYLVNELVRGDDDHFEIFLGNQRRINFLKEINPPGGFESTAQITRFTTQEISAPEETYPVKIRLLNKTDLVKIFANGYAFECKQTISQPDFKQISESANSSLKSPEEEVLFNHDEIYEIEQYIKREIDNDYFDALNKQGYWENHYNAISAGNKEIQLRYLSFLWGNIESLTILFRQLLKNLKTVDSEVIWVEKECLLPRDRSIIYVQTIMRHLRRKSDDKIGFITSRGVRGYFSRTLLSALTAELILEVPQKVKNHFIGKMDVLDFPGAKATGNNYSRDQLNTPPGDPESPDYLAEVFLRGKIAHLFNMYVETRELTSLILCCPPGEIEALSMPRLIQKWINQTHGKNESERTGKDVALYVAFTKFDETLLMKDGEPVDSPARWESRLKMGFTDFFAKGGQSWPEKWDGNGPFKNCYWIRNPKVKSGIFHENPETGKEGLSPEYEEWLKDLKDHYMNNEHVQTHFSYKNMNRSWTEVSTPDRNGIQVLLEELTNNLRPDLKCAILNLEIQRIFDRLESILKPLIGDAADLVEAKRKATICVNE